MGRIYPFLFALVALSLPLGALAQTADNPEELVLDREAIIEVTIAGVPRRFKVDPGHSGAAAINPSLARELFAKADGIAGWDFGEFALRGYYSEALIDFGFATRMRRLAWTPYTVSGDYDGVIGVHDLPHRKVTFLLGQPSESETVQRFKTRIVRNRNFPRLGTYVDVGDKRLFMMFSPNMGPNVTTAGTANFVATRQEGGFIEETGIVEYVFGVKRPTRTMRLGIPMLVGDLVIEDFAVRVEDHGNTKRVGEFDPTSPLNTAQNIVVKRGKGKGRADLLSRIGGDQIAHCSRLSFDMKKMEAELSCAPQ